MKQPYVGECIGQGIIQVLKKQRLRKPFRFKIGDYVRLTHLKNPFSREYDERWTDEIFVISQKILRRGLPVFRVQDFDKDEIEGTFYQSELQKVNVKDDGLWKVENILKTKGKEETNNILSNGFIIQRNSNLGLTHLMHLTYE